MRGVETGRETWEFETKDYEDMLNVASRGSNYPSSSGQSDKTHKPRDVYFCGPYQRGECTLDSPHIARVGMDGQEKLVHHICSACLFKDGKKLNHPNRGPRCLRARLP